MHALLSDRELSIHSHHPGLLVRLTERFCNQSVNVKLIHTPIRPMIQNRAVSGFHLEFCIKVFILLQQFCFLTHQISDQRNYIFTLPHIYASCQDCERNQMYFLKSNLSYIEINMRKKVSGFFFLIFALCSLYMHTNIAIMRQIIEDIFYSVAS